MSEEDPKPRPFSEMVEEIGKLKPGESLKLKFAVKVDQAEVYAMVSAVLAHLNNPLLAGWMEEDGTLWFAVNTYGIPTQVFDEAEQELRSLEIGERWAITLDRGLELEIEDMDRISMFLLMKAGHLDMRAEIDLARSEIGFRRTGIIHMPVFPFHLAGDPRNN